MPKTRRLKKQKPICLVLESGSLSSKSLQGCFSWGFSPRLVNGHLLTVYTHVFSPCHAVWEREREREVSCVSFCPVDVRPHSSRSPSPRWLPLSPISKYSPFGSQCFNLWMWGIYVSQNRDLLFTEHLFLSAKLKAAYKWPHFIYIKFQKCILLLFGRGWGVGEWEDWGLEKLKNWSRIIELISSWAVVKTPVFLMSNYFGLFISVQWLNKDTRIPKTYLHARWLSFHLAIITIFWVMFYPPISQIRKWKSLVWAELWSHAIGDSSRTFSFCGINSH